MILHFYYDSVFDIFTVRQTPVCIAIFRVGTRLRKRRCRATQSRRVSASAESKPSPTECLSTQADIKRNRGPAVDNEPLRTFTCFLHSCGRFVKATILDDHSRRRKGTRGEIEIEIEYLAERITRKRLIYIGIQMIS